MKKPATEEEKFHATYTPISDADSLSFYKSEELNEEKHEPTELGEIVDNCKEHALDAVLEDYDGNSLGWVNAWGRSCVGEGQ